MKTIGIIGVGLIGGSLGMVLRRHKYRVIGIGRNRKKLLLAKKLKAVDEYTTDFGQGAGNSDIIVIATPVDIIVSIAKRILPYIKPDTIITDAGSVKTPVVYGINSFCRSFVGGHPLAGSEKTGVKSARADIFKKATVVITPLKTTPSEVIKTVSKLWKTAGAKVLLMSPREHDRLVSMVSHLPHVLSAVLVNTLTDKAGQLIAGSFQDMTRISDSDPHSWAGICWVNRDNLKRELTEFRRSINKISSRLNSKQKLEKFFYQAKSKRTCLLSNK